MRLDFKIAASYLIGYGHIWWIRCGSGRFDVLRSVCISQTFKLSFVDVHFWLFWIKCLETLKIEQIWNILKTLI